MGLKPINSLTIEGKISRDVQVRKYAGKDEQGGRLAFGSIKSLAVTKGKDGKPVYDGVDLSFTAFGWVADTLEGLKKDQVVVLTGRLQNNTFVDKKTNQKRYEVKLIVERALKVDWKKTGKAEEQEEENEAVTTTSPATPDNSWMDED